MIANQKCNTCSKSHGCQALCGELGCFYSPISYNPTPPEFVKTVDENFWELGGKSCDNCRYEKDDRETGMCCEHCRINPTLQSNWESKRK